MTQQIKRGPGRPVGVQTGRTREALLEATRELLAQRGLPRLTLRDVADRAGVQPALIRYYFGDKQGLLRAVIAEVAAAVERHLAAAATQPGGPQERLRALIVALVDAFALTPCAPRLLVEQLLFADEDTLDRFVDEFARPHLKAIRSLLAAGRAEGTLRSVEPLFLLTSAVGASVMFFLAAPIVRRLFDVPEITPEIARGCADRTAELLLHGLLKNEPAA